VTVLVLGVWLSREGRQYRQTFLAPSPRDPLQHPFDEEDEEVEWLKGYFSVTGYQLTGHDVTTRDAWMIETTTTQEAAAPVQFGPSGPLQRLDDGFWSVVNDGNAAADVEAAGDPDKDEHDEDEEGNA